MNIIESGNELFLMRLLSSTKFSIRRPNFSAEFVVLAITKEKG